MGIRNLQQQSTREPQEVMGQQLESTAWLWLRLPKFWNSFPSFQTKKKLPKPDRFILD